MKSERKHWLRIARAFEWYHETGGEFTSLDVANAAQLDHASLEVLLAMKERLVNAPGPRWLWPCTQEHAAKRAALARRFAEECLKD